MFDHIIAIHTEPGHPILAGDLAWATERNAEGWGIYWHVNAVRPGVTTKATKADVTGVRFAHVDIDPPKHGPWDKQGTLARLMGQGPSVVIDSGNGLQGLWALTPGATIEQVELVNRGLIQFFNADKGTWNVDRVFRVPGLVNWPNAAKVALGREPVLASELHRSDAVYDVATLLACWPYVPPAAGGGGSDEIDPIPYEVCDLPDTASERTRTLVRHPAGADRSSDVALAVTSMARDGMSDAQIMGVIMNPELPISAHCLDQHDPERAARRKCSLAAAHRFDPERAFGEPVELPAGALAEPIHVTRGREAGFSPRDGGVMSPADQMEHFKGCVYVTSLDKVIAPNGELYTRSRFDSVYGGHMFIIDAMNEKTTKAAWEAFTNNQLYAAPTANYLCFRPEEPIGAIVQDGTRLLYNTYVPIDTPCMDGDVGPFLDHVARLFPVERDRRILLTYMASLVQNPGVKFQWAPVIVGVQGNGKTLLISVLVECLGEQYCYLPNTAKMTRNGINFNGWIQGKLFLGMEEVYSANRRDFLEEFKTYVTNLRLPIEGKGQDEYMGDNRANMVFLTNHEDGIPFDPDERRYAAMFTAQREKADKARDGMGGDYFPRLWRWLRSGGFAKVNGFLRSYRCEAEFDPAQDAVDAPHTSSTERAIRAGRGVLEQEVMAAVEDERPGFAGGWISSKALDTLFKERNIRLAPNKRPAMLAKLGYGAHPMLVDGRTPGVVLPDAVRCRLYIRDGHISRASTDPCEAYTKAQMRAGVEIAEARLGA